MTICRSIVILIFSTMGLLSLLLSCDNKSPTTPQFDTGYTLSGRIIDDIYGGKYNVAVSIKGVDYDHYVVTDRTGWFTVSDLKAGQYTLRASKRNSKVLPDSLVISVPTECCRSAIFLCLDLIRYDYFCSSNSSYVFGRIFTDTYKPLPFVNVTLGCNSSLDGHYLFQVTKNTPTVIYPHKNNYSFIPDSIRVVSQDPIVILDDLIAHYTGPVQYSISGRVVVEGEGFGPVFVKLKQNENILKSIRSYSDGRFLFEGLGNGDYIITIEAANCDFQSDSFEVIVKDADIFLPDIQGTYHGETFYDVTGRVINQEGMGVQGASITLHSSEILLANGTLQTDENGVYEAEEIVATKNNTSLISALSAKSNCIFLPDSATVSFSWKDRTIHGGSIVFPDFIAMDYTLFTPSDYFPLSAPSPWTCIRTVNLLPAADFSITASGPLTQNGQTYHRLSPTGPAGFTAYRVEGNSVYTLLDNAAVELLRFGVIPGTAWEIGKSGGYPLKGSFIGLETVTVPAGTFPDCLRFQVRKEYGATTHETYTLWFAKDIGMVRSEKILVNYGAEKERVADELK